MRFAQSLKWIGVAVVLSFGSAAYACPVPASGAQSFSATSSQLYSAATRSVSAGGDTALRSCNLGAFSGYVPGVAQLAVDFSNTDGYALEFRVQGGCDTVLLVNGPDGRWHWDDDSAGSLNPLIRLSGASSGRYAVWVGTVSSGNCSANLNVETFN